MYAGGHYPTILGDNNPGCPVVGQIVTTGLFDFPLLYPNLHDAQPAILGLNVVDHCSWNMSSIDCCAWNMNPMNLGVLDATLLSA